MEKINKMSLDNEILKDMKEALENRIDFAFKKSIKENKTIRVNLKMTISTENDSDGNKKPKIEYETGFNIKEDSFKNKSTVLKDLTAEVDEDGNILMEEENKQLEIEEEGEEEEDSE